MKIMLVCNAGVSTSIVVQKMQKFAAIKNIDVMIEAIPTAEAINRTEGWDVILLGPQVKFYLENYKNIVKGTIPVGVIETRMYGTANGQAVLEQALKLISEFQDNEN